MYVLKTNFLWFKAPTAKGKIDNTPMVAKKKGKIEKTPIIEGKTKGEFL